MDEIPVENLVTHQQFLKKRKLEKKQEWKQKCTKTTKKKLLEIWQTCNRPTKLSFLQEVFQKDGQSLLKEFKEEDEDFSRLNILMRQLSQKYESQKAITHPELLDLLAPLWTHPELKAKG